MKNLCKSYKYILYGLILALEPVISCLIMLALDGKTPGAVSIAASTWNDELFYFKQVEGMVNNAVPAGFFGYNESAAQFFSFGAWSPVILIPWAAFGKIFGWTMTSPMIANLVFLSISLFLFPILSKIDIKKIIVIFVVFICVSPLTRYIFSVMPEIVIISGLIVLCGLILGYKSSKNKTLRHIFSCLIIFAVTIVRPYYAVLYIFPFVQGNSLNKNETSKPFISTKRVFTVIAAGLSVVSYFLISGFFCAPYFGDIFSTEWLTVFSQNGFLAGTKNFCTVIIHYVYAVLSASLNGIKSGYGIGVYFAAFLMLGLILVIEAVRLFKKDKDNSILLICLVVSETVFFAALILMYSLGDGFRHLLAFTVMSLLFTICADTSRYFMKEVIILVIVSWLFLVKGNSEYYFKIPYDGDGAVSKNEIQTINSKLQETMIATSELSFDNDVIVLLSDKVGDNTGGPDCPYAYAIPEGFGYSICTADYVLDNINSLKSRYIMLPTGGMVDTALMITGREPFYSNKDISLYKLY